MKDSLEPKTSGHDVDRGTFTTTGDKFTAWITKLNKHEGDKGKEASVLEAAFSETALLFIKPGLTPPAQIVTDEQGNVTGVASENFNMQIKKQMDKGTTCYSIYPHNWSFEKIPHVANVGQGVLELQRKKLKERTQETLSDEQLSESLQLAENTRAVNFLDKMPKNFFVELMKKHKSGEVVVDMESLASILTASYVLEEDDLHKGNIGFYITDTIGPDGSTKKQFNFFKIDHDLMFIDSIMSQKDQRLANIFYNKDSFQISTRDLDDFPDLKDSGNHYWPTQERSLAKGDKAYKSKEERAAFANLKDDEQFRNAKWKYFLKSAIMPIDLIEKSLTSQLDTTKEIDKINMVKNAISTRVEKLKGKLLESAQFREYMEKHGEKAFEGIRKEIEEYLQSSGISVDQKKKLMDQLEENFNELSECSKNYNMQSPIYRSILSGSYNFSKKTKTTVFGGFEFSKKTVTTEDHIHLAMHQFDKAKERVDANTFTRACIAIDVIKKSGKAEDYAQELNELQQAKNKYINPTKVKTFEEFVAMADRIRATNLPLKQQKRELIAALKEVQLPLDVLQKLKAELKKDEPTSPSLKFIKQLRSESWFVRKVLGTYGETSAASLMLSELNSKISKNCVSATQRFKSLWSDAVPKTKSLETDLSPPPPSHSKGMN